MSPLNTVEDVLDLHTFAPREIADLVDHYLTEARSSGHREVRIIHGKGTGTLRRVVHGICGRHPGVAQFALAPAHLGGWGATVVALKPPD